MASLIYSLYGDNILAGIAPTITVGTALSLFPVANLTNLNPAKPCRTTGTTARFVWDLTTAKKGDWAALIMHNLDAGLLGVKVEANSVNNFASPPLSIALPIPAIDADLFHIDAGIDITGIGTRTYEFWSLAITTANSINLSLGEFAIFGTKRSMPTNLNWPEDRTDSRPVVEQKTRKGSVFVLDQGTRQSNITADIDNTDANEVTMRQWWLETRGRARPFFIWPDPAVNDVRMVRWADTTRKRSQQVNDRNQVTLAFEQVDRGIVF